MIIKETAQKPETHIIVKIVRELNIVWLAILLYGSGLLSNNIIMASDVTSGGTINISLFPLPAALDIFQIKSASEYILLHHLLRRLVTHNKTGRLLADLAEKWEIRNDFKYFLFHIKSSAKYSDGTVIRAQDVAHGFQLQMDRKSAIHFDFSQIESVKAISNNLLEITLKKRNPNFINQLDHPEFGVVHPSDKAGNFGISSGAYYLASFNISNYKLVKNPHFELFNADAPTEVNIKSVPTNEQIKQIDEHSLHFSIPLGISSIEDIVIKTHGKNITLTFPHIGFTYWISLDSKSKNLTKLSTRQKVQYLVYQFAQANIPEQGLPWSRANQLYFPDGFGRPSQKEISSVWSEIQKKADSSKKLTLKLLTNRTFPFNDKLAEWFLKSGITLNVDYYLNQEDFVKKTHQSKFDLVLINNDFSSLDLLENLQVTFNPARPLIFLPSPKHLIRKLLNQANENEHSAERNELFKQISLETLKQGLIAPLAYNKLAFLHSKSLNVDEWSTLFPEISFWKTHLSSL